MRHALRRLAYPANGAAPRAAAAHALSRLPRRAVDWAREASALARTSRALPRPEFLALAASHRFMLVAPGDMLSTRKIAEARAGRAAPKQSSHTSCRETSSSFSAVCSSSPLALPQAMALGAAAGVLPLLVVPSALRGQVPHAPRCRRLPAPARQSVARAARSDLAAVRRWR